MKNKYYILKKILMLSMSVFVFILFSCGGKENGVTKVSFWVDQTQTDRQAQLQLMIDTFQALNPQYIVEMVAIDVNDMPSQIAAAAAANTLPNLIHTSTQFQLSYDEEGLIDTKATEEFINELGKDRFFSGAINLSKSMSHGGYFMVPYHFMVQGIWYRKDWFEEAGLAPPSTKDALLKAAKYFYQPEKNQYGLLIGTQAQQQYNEQNFLQISTAHNAYLFNKDGSLAIDSPEMRDAVEYYKELSQYTPPGPQTWRSRDYYLQGKLAMFFYSSYIMDDLALQEVATNSLSSDNFEELEGADFDKNLVVNTGFVPALMWDVESGYAEMAGLSILKTDNKKAMEGTKVFLDFLYEKDNYISWLHLVPGGQFPVFKEIVETDEFFDDPKGVYSKYGKEKIKALVQGINYVKSFLIRDGVMYPQAATVAAKLIIPDMLYEVTEADVPIDEALTEAKQKIDKALAE